MYVLYNLKYTYISKHNESTKIYAIESTWLKRMYMYNNSLDKMDIYMKFKHKHVNMKTKIGIQVKCMNHQN